MAYASDLENEMRLNKRSVAFFIRFTAPPAQGWGGRTAPVAADRHFTTMSIAL